MVPCWQISTEPSIIPGTLTVYLQAASGRFFLMPTQPHRVKPYQPPPGGFLDTPNPALEQPQNYRRLPNDRSNSAQGSECRPTPIVEALSEMKPENIGAIIVSIIATVAFVAVLILWALKPPSVSSDVLSVLVGALAAGYIQTLNFWFGSSSGSKDKDKAISSLSASAK
jgi:hypothetical protein